MNTIKNILAFCTLFTACLSFAASPASPSAAISVSRAFGDIAHYTLRNNKGMEVGITNYGATITSIRVSDSKGIFADVALGYDSFSEYLNANDKPYFGAVVGRYGNRIRNGQSVVATHASRRVSVRPSAALRTAVSTIC